MVAALPETGTQHEVSQGALCCPPGCTYRQVSTVGHSTPRVLAHGEASLNDSTLPSSTIHPQQDAVSYWSPKPLEVLLSSAASASGSLT